MALPSLLEFLSVYVLPCSPLMSPKFHSKVTLKKGKSEPESLFVGFTNAELRRKANGNKLMCALLCTTQAVSCWGRNWTSTPAILTEWRSAGIFPHTFKSSPAKCCLSIKLFMYCKIAQSAEVLSWFWWSPQQPGLVSPKKAEVCEGVLSVSEGGSLDSCPPLIPTGIVLAGFSLSASSQARLVHGFLMFCGSGVTRLADISLNDPVSISIADEIQKLPEPASQTNREASSSSSCMEQGNFAVPETLQQYVMVVPSKLRLVTLAAFILQKCKVRLCLHLYY